jgi:predicted Rossmann fold nucleotide-binding protein DprA/Smf involved in DNA uptake
VTPTINKIISGGQTGVDRAAFDAAIANGIEIGGFVPRGRWAEDGTISENYKGLIETESEDPAERTQLNVINSDATLLLTAGEPEGGSKLTADMAFEYKKPLLHLKIRSSQLNKLTESIREWLEKQRPAILNIAGSRASEDPEIYDLAYEILSTALTHRPSYI